MALVNLNLPGDLLGGTNVGNVVSIGGGNTNGNTIADIGLVADLPGVTVVDGRASILSPEGDLVAASVGANVRVGTGAADLIDGALGDDVIFGGGGDDRINGGAGNDVLDGGADNDAIYGNQGNDTLYGRDGNDLMNGGQGDDLIYGNQGNDTVTGSQGRDTVFGGQGNDVVDYSGFTDAQLVYGNFQDDVITGGEGADRLFGGQGNDVVRGGGGGDALYGNLGDDVLTGGAGADRFVIANLIMGVNSGADRITDFDAGEGDRIALNGQTYTAQGDTNGNTVLALSGGGTVTLDGVMAGSVQASWFV